GRVECVSVQGRSVWLFLAKNPVGFNEVLRTLFHDGECRDLLVILNDNEADGRDVSWIWDVDFEPFVPWVRRATFSGIRAEDMALRFKYAELPAERGHLEKDLERALDAALDGLPEGGSLYILPTYTAMLAIRGVLARRGHV